MTIVRTVRVAVGVVAVLAATACGGDDDAGNGEASTAPALEEVQTCLEAAGLQTSTDSVIPAETRKLLGIEGSLSLNGSDELFGLGSITWYVDSKTAAEAHEAGAAVRTDDVARDVQGTVAWDYAGGDAAVAVIEGCLEGAA